jgi:hypothetical protein
MREFSEGDIERWSQQSPDNAELYRRYCYLQELAKVAWQDNDGAAYTGLAHQRTRVREEIGRRMFDD